MSLTRQGKYALMHGNGAELFAGLFTTLGLLRVALPMRYRKARLAWALGALFVGAAGTAYTQLR